MKKPRIKNIILIGIFVICAAVFIYAAAQVYSIFSQRNQSNVYNENLVNDSVNYNSDASSDTTENKENSSANTSPITVNFDTLYAESKETVAWIYCENTPINYPVAQGDDNQKYLSRMLNGEYNAAGTIFEDYRNSDDFSDLNTILYGHSMNNGSMFGTLSYYKEQSYYDSHPVMYLVTPKHNYIIKLFAGYVTNPKSDAYSIPQSAEQLEKLIETARQNSTFISDVETSKTDRIITLSTCSYEYDDARYVVVGKLVEIND